MAKIVVDQGRKINDTANKKSKKKLFGNSEDKEELKRRRAATEGDFTDPKNSYFDNSRPKQGFQFYSDVFSVDDAVGCVYNFVNIGNSDKLMPRFWGVNLIPQGLKQDVQVVLVQSHEVMTEEWVYEHQDKADEVVGHNAAEASGAQTRREQTAMAGSNDDLDVIASELANGAVYMGIKAQLMVKAPDLDKLMEALDAIERWNSSKFATLKLRPYHGMQRQAMSNLYGRFQDVLGQGFYLTSTEYAGSYNVMTQGIDDPAGFYIGDMSGDVNNSAVIMDLDNFDGRAIIACGTKFNPNEPEQGLSAESLGDLFAVKMSNACLTNGGRVVHLVINDTDLNKIGAERENGQVVDLAPITTTINMDSGDVNPFEVFGQIDPETGEVLNELNDITAHVAKLVAMFNQMYEGTGPERRVAEGYLTEIIMRFYENEGMWRRNAKDKLDELRMIGLPHASYPKLSTFMNAVSLNRKAEVAKGDRRDPNELAAITNIHRIFKMMIDVHGDLFNVITSSTIDDVASARRVVYEFSQLRQRGLDLAMMQLINVVNYATSSMSDGDAVFIHGADYIDERLKEYLSTIVDNLIGRRVRVVYVYADVENMLASRDFNRFDVADYTVTGMMSDLVYERYRDIIKQELPDSLVSLLTQVGSGNQLYIHRDIDNVIFDFNPLMRELKEVV